MNKLKLITTLFLIIALAATAFAATVVESGSDLFATNQVLLGCDNNVAQKLAEELYLDSDDCIAPGANSARIKLIMISGLNPTHQILLVGDDVGLEAAIEVLRNKDIYSAVLRNPEIIVSRVAPEERYGLQDITVTVATPGVGSATVPTLTALGNGNYRYSVDLEEGWNFISFPIVLDEDNPNVLFDSMRSKMVRVYSYDPAQTGVKWIKWNPELGAPSEITQIVPQRGYIIYMDEAATLTTQGRAGVGTPEVPPSLAIAGGWNLLTVHGFMPKKMSSALNSISGKYDSVWTIVNNQLARLEVSNNPDLQPGQTYWVHLTNSGTLVP